MRILLLALLTIISLTLNLILYIKIRDIKKRVFYDYLTGIPNKASFEHTFDILWNSKKSFSFAMIDMDNLKIINDCFGHIKGDCALSELAKLLSEHFATFRIGGDEFVILAEGVSESEIKQILLKIQQTAYASDIKFSFGVSTSTNHNSKGSLYTEAEKLMYEQKKNNRLIKA